MDADRLGFILIKCMSHTDECDESITDLINLAYTQSYTSGPRPRWQRDRLEELEVYRSPVGMDAHTNTND